MSAEDLERRKDARPKGNIDQFLFQYNFLVPRGYVSQEVYDKIVTEIKEIGFSAQKDVSAFLERRLLENGVSLSMIGDSIEQFYRHSYFNFNPATHEYPANLMAEVKRSVLETVGWLPLSESGDTVSILTADPMNAPNRNPSPSVVFRGKTVRIKVTTYQEYDLYASWLFEKAGFSSALQDDASGGHIDDLIASMQSDEEVEIEPVTSEQEDSEVVQLVNKIILDAYKSGVSDIHIEPLNRGKRGVSIVRIRNRKDGVMSNYIDAPFKYRAAIISRIKIMSELDISERRKPQDGKIKMTRWLPGGPDIELRVATLPTQGGAEDVVMRILAAGEPVPLDKMMFSERNVAMLKAAIERPYGLFFVCGPTGSGKTTTLHSILSYLNTPDTKIWTAEDPVEITQEGLRQVQVNKKAGIDFATVMRSFLRADPDIIMVGEMRDHETVKIGVEASLTGHLVLSTLHTNSAPESVVRLLDMGMDPFNFADALVGILAQRLARKLCGCKTSRDATEQEIGLLLDEYTRYMLDMKTWNPSMRDAIRADWERRFAVNGRLQIHTANGCAKCQGGYSGRIGLHELMPSTDEVKFAIQSRAKTADLTAIALNAGMRTLKQDGIEKSLQGLTDIQQVRKVCIS